MGQLTDYDYKIVHDNVPWIKYLGKRILVTGGTGFIGKWMQFPKHGSFRFLDHSTYYYDNWENEKWDYIFHLANVSPDRVISCAKMCGAKILYASSGAVLDRNPKEYALNKIRWEEMMHESGTNYVIARMYAFMGAFMPNKYAIINFIHDAIAGGPIVIRGDPLTVRAYLYAADMTVWLHRIMLFGKNRETYNVCGCEEITMQHLAGRVSGYFENMNVIHRMEYPCEERPYYVDMTKKTEIDCKVRYYTDLEHMIKKTIESYYG